MTMANERWFQSDTLFVTESGRSAGEFLDASLPNSYGDDFVIPTALPDDEDAVGFFFMGSDGWAKYYVIRRYGLSIGLDIVQSIDMRFAVPDPGTGSSTMFGGNYLPLEKLEDGLISIRYHLVKGARLYEANDDHVGVRLIRLTATGAQVGPERVVTHDVLPYSAWWESYANMAFLGLSHTGKLMCMYSDGRGSFRDTTKANRFKVLAYAEYSYDPSTLAMSLATTPVVIYDWFTNDDDSGVLRRTVSPDHILDQGNGKLLVFGGNYAHTNSADQVTHGAYIFSYDGLSAPVWVSRGFLPYTWATGLGTYTPRFSQLFQLTRGPFSGYGIYGGWGVGAASDREPIGIIKVNDSNVIERSGTLAGDDPDNPGFTQTFPDDAVHPQHHGNHGDAFDVMGAIDTEEYDIANYSWHADTSGGTQFYGVPTTLGVYTGSPVIDEVTGDISVQGSQYFVMPFQVNEVMYSYAGWNQVHGNGYGLTYMGDGKVTIGAFTSKYPYISSSPSMIELIAPQPPFDKTFRVFTMFYKQGVNIPKLLIPRKRWAYTNRRHLDKLMDKNLVRPEHRGVWLDGIEEWSKLRGMADEENYLSMEEWVKQTRLDNGQTD